MTSATSTPSMTSTNNVDHQYSSVSKELTATLSKVEKRDNGIYFTPPSCVHHSIELLLPHLPKKAAKNAKFRILEPSFGSGEYITALRKRFPVSNITGVEKNKTIFDAVVQKYFPNTVPGITLLNADFLAYESGTPYNLIIGNPPYFVMKKEEVDAAYQQYYDGRPNIFILFIIKCLRMLADGGIMSFVLPKSFLNCLYYDKTRKYINDKFEILNIVECSDDKYIETAQETVIIIIRKGVGAGAEVRAAAITDAPFVMRGAYTIFNTKENIAIFKRLYENSKTLADLRFKVSVGKVVWNQCKDILTDDESKTLLIYSSNITNNRLEIKTYKNDEKKNYINKPGVRTPMIVLNRGYGTGEYKFSYCLIGGGGGREEGGYLVENHLICIECVDKIDNADAIARYKKVMKSFTDERTAEFIRVYFGNSAINTTELGNILPIYGDI